MDYHGTFGSSSNFMSRIRQSDLRPALMLGAFIAFIWWLIAGVSSFRNVPIFNSNHESTLGVFYIILGCFGMAIVAIETFGMFAVASRRVVAVRIYAYLSILVVLLIAAFYIIQTVLHYSFRNGIIDLCIDADVGDRIFFTGFFGPIDGGIVSPLEAQAWCNRQYDRNSLSNIVALLVVTAIAILFAIFVFAYLRQLSDSTKISGQPAVPLANFRNFQPPYPHPQPSDSSLGRHENLAPQPYPQLPPDYKSGKSDEPLPSYDGFNPKFNDHKDGF